MNLDLLAAHGGLSIILCKLIWNTLPVGEYPLSQVLTDTVWKENRQLKQHLSPVLNPTCPFANDIHRSQVKHLEQGFIARENTLALRDFSKLAMVTLDDVRGINELAKLRWILEKGR